MITMFIMPNFEGTRIEKYKTLITCLILDAMYIVPILM